MKSFLSIALVLAFTGCQSAPRKDVDRLLAHPEFAAAARSAPNFTKEALETVARLDHELRSRK